MLFNTEFTFGGRSSRKARRRQSEISPSRQAAVARQTLSPARSVDDTTSCKARRPRSRLPMSLSLSSLTPPLSASCSRRTSEDNEEQARMEQEEEESVALELRDTPRLPKYIDAPNVSVLNAVDLAESTDYFPLFRPVPRKQRDHQRPPPLNLEGPQEENDAGILSPFQLSSSVAVTATPKPELGCRSRWRHSKEGVAFGLQLLAQSLTSGDDDGDEGDEQARASMDREALHPGHKLMDQPPLSAIGETAMSRTSSVSTSTSTDATSISDLSLCYDRKASMATTSTAPTSVSLMSISEDKSRPSSSASHLSTMSTTTASTIDDDEVPTSPLSISEATAIGMQSFAPADITAPTSRRSSVSTFYCRGASARHYSIGLGSIADDEVDLEQGLDDLEAYQGVENLKAQSSWLLSEFPNEDDLYESDDEDNSEVDYHTQLSLITKTTSGLADGRIFSTLTPPKPKAVSTSRRVETPSCRKSRRRTISSEAVVFEALEEMERISAKGDEKSGGWLSQVEIPVVGEWDMIWDEEIFGSLEMLMNES